MFRHDEETNLNVEYDYSAVSWHIHEQSLRLVNTDPQQNGLTLLDLSFHMVYRLVYEPKEGLLHGCGVLGLALLAPITLTAPLRRLHAAGLRGPRLAGCC